ncbi:MAG: Lrp/AsnC ligand binding domain-containing protein [Nonomuraea sp.]|nr:Lrp/AsnC ligand binding domain-containing protein [Nonomuraea sp.]
MSGHGPHCDRRPWPADCTNVPPAAIGFPAEARLWINARPARVVEIAEALAREPEVSFAALTTGPTNLLVALACRGVGDLGRFLTERIAALDGIHTMETAPIIRTVKRAGALLL